MCSHSLRSLFRFWFIKINHGEKYLSYLLITFWSWLSIDCTQFSGYESLGISSFSLSWVQSVFIWLLSIIAILIKLAKNVLKCQESSFDCRRLKLGSPCVGWDSILYVLWTELFFGWVSRSVSIGCFLTSSESSYLKALWDLQTPFLPRFNYSFGTLALILRECGTQGSNGGEALGWR